MQLPTLRLNKNEDRRINGGHVWIYSNEVDNLLSPLKAFTPGQQAIVEASNGKKLGIAYVNPQSLICGRMVSRDIQQPLDFSLLVARLQCALRLRERLFTKPFYRLVFAESDNLPGLIVDRYGDILVVQMNTAGMDVMTDAIITALHEVLQPSAILLRNDSSQRLQEGLIQEVKCVYGEIPPQVLIEENGAQFHVSLWDGQKTGWFYDHRMARQRLQNYVTGKRVLDVFSYVGGWGIQAAVYGATAVTCIDSSAKALVLLKANASLNAVEDKIQTLQADAFNALSTLIQAKEKFDVVVLDPPAFIKRRKDNSAGGNAYQRINEAALQLLNPEGILISASCSMLLSREDFISILRRASVKQQRELIILEQGHQGPDHPIHPAILEMEYLKTVITRVI
ncbi:class I SAM-dependent rRNA methyltransferase [soil metagenome]